MWQIIFIFYFFGVCLIFYFLCIGKYDMLL